MTADFTNSEKPHLRAFQIAREASEADLAQLRLLILEAHREKLTFDQFKAHALRIWLRLAFASRSGIA